MKPLTFFMVQVIILAKPIEIVPFDWGGQFGYVSWDGAIMWNQDWLSNRLLFDGTWAIYPRMYGHEIEAGFVDGMIGSSGLNDSTLVMSYLNTTREIIYWTAFHLGQDI